MTELYIVDNEVVHNLTTVFWEDVVSRTIAGYYIYVCIYIYKLILVDWNLVSWVVGASTMKKKRSVIHRILKVDRQ